MQIGKSTLVISLALGAFVGTACEPQANTRPRVRTSPTLVASENCDALTTVLTDRIRDEVDTRVLLAARQMSYGSTGNNAWVYLSEGLSPALDDPHAIHSGRVADAASLDERLILNDGAFLALSDRQLTRFTLDDTGAPVVDAAVSIEGSARAFARIGDDIVVVSEVDPFSMGSTHPLAPHLRQAKNAETPSDPVDRPTVVDGTVFVAWTKISRFDMTQDLAEKPARYLEGTSGGLFAVGDRTFLAVAFDVFSTALRLWPSTESDFIGVFSTGRAVSETNALNAEIIEAMTLDDVTPRHVVVTNGAPSLVDTDCTSVWAAEDGAARSILSLVEVRGDATVDVTSLLAKQATLFADDTGVFVVEEAAPLWWYFGTDLPLQTNVHRLEHDGVAITPKGSRRLLGLSSSMRFMSMNDDGALVIATSDIINETTIDGRPSTAHLYNIDPSLTVAERTSGLAPDEPPGRVTTLFQHAVYETRRGFDDALIFVGANLDGGAPMAVPGTIARALVDDDQQSAYLVEHSIDDFGFRAGPTRVSRVTPTTLHAPDPQVTIAAVPSAVIVDDGSEFVEAPTFGFGFSDGQHLYALTDDLLLIPQVGSAGGLGLSVIARLRDGGLAPAGSLVDTFGGNSAPSMERVLVVDGFILTLSAGGVVVRALAGLTEVGRVENGAGLASSL